MKLKQFQVYNYRSINDSGLIDVSAHILQVSR